MAGAAGRLRQTLRSSPARWLNLLCCITLLAGCASRPPAGRDGPPANPPPDLERVPDAVPRVELLRSGGPNKPYEVLGQRHVPLTGDVPLRESGLASWYGRKFHGQPTANGEIYDMYAMTAAHKTMPIPSYARVRNPANGREIIVRVNDRGPFAAGRVIDLSYVAALKLGLLAGVAPVQVQRLTFDDIRAGVGRSGGRGGDSAALPPDDPAPGDAAPGTALAATTTTTTTATTTTTTNASSPGWWLQFGAFRSRDGALRLQQDLQQRLQGEATAAGAALAVFEQGEFFRVQAGPYASREAAQDAGERLRRSQGLAALAVWRDAAAP